MRLLVIIDDFLFSTDYGMEWYDMAFNRQYSNLLYSA